LYVFNRYPTDFVTGFDVAVILMVEVFPEPYKLMLLVTVTVVATGGGDVYTTVSLICGKKQHQVAKETIHQRFLSSHDAVSG